MPDDDRARTSTTPRSAPPATCARSSATRPSSRTARCRCKVPANVAFQFSIARRERPPHFTRARQLAAAAPRRNARVQRLPPARHRPTPHVAWAQTALRLGQPRRGRHRQRALPGSRRDFSPDHGRDHGAGSRTRSSCVTGSSSRCADLNLSVNAEFTDVWTDPAQRTPDPDIINLSYADTSFTTLPPTSPPRASPTWASTCRIVINYTQHIQPLWDKVRQVVDRTPTRCWPTTPARAPVATTRRMPWPRRRCRRATGSAPTVASDEQPLQLRSYRELFFTDNEQAVIMGGCRTGWCRVLWTRTAIRRR